MIPSKIDRGDIDRVVRQSTSGSASAALAEPAYSIYEAFDRGEYSIDGEDPVLRHTVPLLRKILDEA